MAVLHDVVEDTSVTLADLSASGFSESIINSVSHVTHRSGESYDDYVVRCKINPVARAVKIADLEDNTRIDRTLGRVKQFESDMTRLRKYVASYKFLTDEITEAEYRLKHRLDNSGGSAA